jgi:hypothetical protein
LRTGGLRVLRWVLPPSWFTGFQALATWLRLLVAHLWQILSVVSLNFIHYEHILLLFFLDWINNVVNARRLVESVFRLHLISLCTGNFYIS